MHSPLGLGFVVSFYHLCLFPVYMSVWIGNRILSSYVKNFNGQVFWLSITISLSVAILILPQLLPFAASAVHLFSKFKFFFSRQVSQPLFPVFQNTIPFFLVNVRVRVSVSRNWTRQPRVWWSRRFQTAHCWFQSRESSNAVKAFVWNLSKNVERK